MTKTLIIFRSSSMVIRIVPPTFKKERRVQLKNLTALRQQGMEVDGLAQLFWTLNPYTPSPLPELIEIFNGCLDFPLPSWEMEELKDPLW
ncbi:hypothetical protein DPX16_22926 [Anabarilius grahami]|uniref:Uncharacterized protein n=1 Tax=Anabarilius grahami TaxID=495550 RepID=A0A3N0Y4E9_ANAGA|nr:hypothetical protein DPX16_22926 [Anabarilius grahami]